MVDIIPLTQAQEFVRSIALETGVTNAQVRDIILLIGPQRSSVVREARLMRKATVV